MEHKKLSIRRRRITGARASRLGHVWQPPSPLARIGPAFFCLFGYLVEAVFLQEPLLKAPSGQTLEECLVQLFLANHPCFRKSGERGVLAEPPREKVGARAGQKNLGGMNSVTTLEFLPSYIGAALSPANLNPQFHLILSSSTVLDLATWPTLPHTHGRRGLRRRRPLWQRILAADGRLLPLRR
jgi:hypothetical protein